MSNDNRPFVFSCDAHIAEPSDLFTARMPEHLSQYAITLTTEGNRRIYRVGDRVIMRFLPDFPAHKTGKTDDEFYAQSASVVDTMRRGFKDLTLRAADMDRDGVDAELCFPTVGLLIAKIGNLEGERAAAQIWNDWAWDYTEPMRDRLIPAAVIPSHDFDDALAECKRAAAKGFAAFCIWEGLNNYNDPRWDPIFAFAGEAGIPIVFHTGFGDIDTRPLKGPGGALFNYTRLMNDSVDIISQLVGGGVLARNPKAHILFAEHSAGWLWSLAERMDEVYIGHANSVEPKLSRMPSQIVRDQVHCSFQNDTGSSMAIHRGIGTSALLFATDYPHSEGTFPFTGDVIRQLRANNPDVAPDDLAEMLGGNAARLFTRANLKRQYEKRRADFLEVAEA
ncbi:amidohydrolase family protein [Sphingomonas oligophenolica]|uniref:Amidohydrolase family protein n=1 Tax=Sphingomonas oligophenolica TaxID=301154 RepID=A0ABU9YA17_9SPHN